MILMVTHMNLILPCVLAVPSIFGAGSHKSHASPKIYVAKDDLKLITPPYLSSAGIIGMDHRACIWAHGPVSVSLMLL